VLDPDLVEFVHGGVAVVVATRDDDLKPQLTRAWGPRVSQDASALTLCVIAAAGSATRANLEGNGAIAIGFGLPSISRAVQIKGTAVSIDEPGVDELERAQAHFHAFTAETAKIGVAPQLPPRLYRHEAEFVSVTVSIAEVYEQTPGPTAGRRL
jgi:hypothetical protein